MHACPVCSTAAAADDYFCGNCGKPLKAAAPDTASGCCCGAGPEAIDASGFCCECGLRQGSPATGRHDYTELVLSDGFAGITDRGRRRATNEDAVLIAEGPSPSGVVRLLAVCDGVSSVSAAGLASAAAVVALRDAALAAVARGDSLTDAVSLGVDAAQAAVCALPYPPDGKAPATTLVAALVRGQQTVLAWAGDSRAYLLAPAQLLLTRDDSWFNDIIGSGALTPEQARRHPYAHAITNCLGAPHEGESFMPHIQEFVLPAQAVLLLCSDGLWNYAEDAGALAQSLPANGSDCDTISLCRHLAGFANGQGGHDNISVAMLRLPSGETRT
jgi:serine/threonine protein phosphatase PrpC